MRSTSPIWLSCKRLRGDVARWPNVEVEIELRKLTHLVVLIESLLLSDLEALGLLWEELLIIVICHVFCGSFERVCRKCIVVCVEALAF